MNKSLLITGSDGFTGSHLTALAEKNGYKVFSLKSDLTDLQAIKEEVLNACPAYVVHLAGISSVTHSDEEAFYRVNLFGSLNLLSALKNLPQQPQKIILASSASIYGNSEEVNISEKVIPNPINHYAMSKLSMEYMSNLYADKLPIVIARPFNYTGVGHDKRFVIPKIIEHFKKHESVIELGNLDVYREYNDVRMVCDVYLKLLQFGCKGEVYNICSGRSYSLREVIALTEKITGQEINVIVNPSYVRPNEVYKLIGQPLKLISTIGDLIQYPLEKTLSWMMGLDKIE